VIKSPHRQMCEDVFKTLIRKGAAVVPGETSAEDVFSSQSDTQAMVEIFKSDADPPPMYVTDCKHVANLHLSFKATKDRVPIRVRIDFGQVYATVSAMKEGLGQQDIDSAEINWLID